MIDGLLGKFEQIQFYPAILKQSSEAKVKELAEQYAVSKTGIDKSTFELNYDDQSVIQMVLFDSWLRKNAYCLCKRS